MQQQQPDWTTSRKTSRLQELLPVPVQIHIRRKALRKKFDSDCKPDCKRWKTKWKVLEQELRHREVDKLVPLYVLVVRYNKLKSFCLFAGCCGGHFREHG